jgi:hypothetical protein
MTESVANKAPIPTATVRRHVDPPGLWIAILSCSVILHASAFLLLRSLALDSLTPKKTSTAIPIDVISVRKTRIKPRVQNVQKPKSTLPIKTLPTNKRSQSPQTPKISPQKVQPAIPVSPQQDAIAFANPRITKKTATPIPKTKPPIKQQVKRQAPPKPQVKSQLEQQFQREIAEQQRQQQLAEKQRQQRITQQELAEQKRQQQLEQQQRQQELAEQKRQQQLEQQQRQQELAEQKRQQQLEQQQRQQELAEQQRQQRITQQQRQREIADQKPRADEVARNQREVPKSSDTVVVNKNPSSPPGGVVTTETGGGFWIANLSALPENVQIDLNSTTGKLQSPPQMRQKTTTPNKLPLLNEKDRQLITQPITCPVLLSIDAKGKIFNNDGIRISDDAPQKNICKRYAEKYFKQNHRNIEFIPARDKGNIPASGGLFVELKIQPVATNVGIGN